MMNVSIYLCMPTNKTPNKKHTYTVLYQPAENSGYVITCPAIPGIFHFADTLQEARKIARKAVMDYLEIAQLQGIKPARDRKVITDKISAPLQPSRVERPDHRKGAFRVRRGIVR